MLNFVCLSLLIWTTESARILGVFPTPVADNFAIGSKLMTELAEKGHNVTFVTAAGMEEWPNKNMNYIYIDNEWETAIKYNLSLMDRISMGSLFSINWYFNFGYDVTVAMFSDAVFKSFLLSNETFDVVIAEYSANEAVVGIAEVFKAPIVLVSPLPASSLMTSVFANPAPTSYVPNILTTHTGVMSYFERLDNLFCNWYAENYRYYLALPWQEDLLNKFINARLSISTVVENISLILLNSHSSITEPVPHVPNMIEVGGLHMNPPNLLPKNLEEFINSARHGAIYFTLDPNLKIGHIEADKMTKILNILGRFKQKFVWNLADESSDYTASNVMFVNGVSHQDVIGHSNIRAVIIDGSLLRIMEAVHFGVPIVGVPLVAEQRSNMARVVRDEYGVQVSFDDLAEENMYEALKEIQDNPKYKLKAESRSRILNDRQVSAIDTAVYWIEYAIRHGGAKHFQSAGVHLSAFQRRLIDIIILLAAIEVVLFLIFYYIFKHILRCCIKKYKNKKSNNYNHLDESTEQ